MLNETQMKLLKALTKGKSLLKFPLNIDRRNLRFQRGMHASSIKHVKVVSPCTRPGEKESERESQRENERERERKMNKENWRYSCLQWVTNIN